jgi:hypothetical protein
MAGTEQGRRHERRRFVTRHDVEDAAAAGQPIRLRGRDALTDEAAQRAADLGVAVERESTAGAARSGPDRGAPPTPPGQGTGAGRTAGSTDDLRRAVRSAVIAELGSEPPGLDAAIERVLQRRTR